MPYRIVVVGGDSPLLLNYGLLTELDAINNRKKYIALGVSPDEIKYEEYFKGDYLVKKESLWRVYVDLPARRLVLGQTLSKIAALTLYEHAKKVYKENRLKLENYASGRIEVHHGLTNEHICVKPEKQFVSTSELIEDEDTKDDTSNLMKIVIAGGLKDKTVRNSTFISGHSVNKDTRWIHGQDDFTSYTLSSVRGIRDDKGKIIYETDRSELNIKCLNPYLKAINNHVHAVSTLDLAGTTDYKREQKANRRDHNAMKFLEFSKKRELTYEQLLQLLYSIKSESENNFVKIRKHLRHMIFIRNQKNRDEKKRPDFKDALFVFNPKVQLIHDEKNDSWVEYIRPGLIPIPNALLKKLISIA